MSGSGVTLLTSRTCMQQPAVCVPHSRHDSCQRCFACAPGIYLCCRAVDVATTTRIPHSQRYSPFAPGEKTWKLEVAMPRPPPLLLGRRSAPHRRMSKHMKTRPRVAEVQRAESGEAVTVETITCLLCSALLHLARQRLVFTRTEESGGGWWCCTV